jgi:hypothetical protein
MLAYVGETSQLLSCFSSHKFQSCGREHIYKIKIYFYISQDIRFILLVIVYSYLQAYDAESVPLTTETLAAGKRLLPGLSGRSLCTRNASNRLCRNWIPGHGRCYIRASMVWLLFSVTESGGMDRNKSRNFISVDILRNFYWWSRGSSVSMFIRLWTGRPGFNSGHGGGILTLCHRVQTPRPALGSIQPPIQREPGSLSPGPRHEADHSPPSTA